MIFRGRKMVEQANIIQFCPECGQTLFRVDKDYLEFRPCVHYAWYGSLGSIGNDEIWTNGLRIRLLKR